MSADKKENKQIQYKAGDIIMKEGDEGGNLLIIKTGVVEVYRERKGTSMPLAQLSKGEILGIMSMLSNRKRTASAKAKTDVIVSEISKSAVEKLISELPRWTNAVVGDLMLRVEQADELYTNQYLENRGHEINRSYIKIGNQLANGFAAFVEIMAQTTENQNIVVNDVLKRFGEVVTIDFEKLRKVYDVFDANKLIDLSNAGSITAVLQQLTILKEYSKFIQVAIENESIEHLISTFAASERATIATCIDFLKGKGHAMDEMYETTLAKLEADMKTSSLEFDLHPFKEAEFYGLLELDKSSNDHVVKFIPIELKNKMVFIETAMALDRLEDVENRISKRTLVY